MTFKTLQSVVVFEQDVYGGFLPIWGYPSLPSTNVLLSRMKAFVHNSPNTQNGMHSTTHRIEEGWAYSCTADIEKVRKSQANDAQEIKVSKGVTQCQITVIAENYHPEQYLSLAEVFCKAYLGSGTPLSLLDIFIKVFTKGSVVSSGGSFDSENYKWDVYKNSLNIKKLIQLFNEEIILIWNGLILKKRILVYSTNPSELSSVMSALPVFLFHRKEWSTYFWPFCVETEEELATLKSSSLYAVGITTDYRTTKIEYDLLVNIDEQNVSVQAEAKSDFILNSFHKSLMKSLLEWGTNDSFSNEKIISLITERTQEFLESIPSYLSRQREKSDSDISKPLANFTRAVAQIEGVSE